MEDIIVGRNEEKAFANTNTMPSINVGSFSGKQGNGWERGQQFSTQRHQDHSTHSQSRGGGDKKSMQCYHCNKFGYFERECKFKNGNEGRCANYKEEEAPPE